jgi:selenide,water dikinase
VLLFTKAIGTGVIATALKFGRAPEPAVGAAVASMETTNRRAYEALRTLPRGTVHACTDITGFGLLGHAFEMAAAGQVTLEIAASSVPILAGALELVRGNVPGGGRTNAEHFGRHVTAAPDVQPDLLQLLYDPQTSGGLLIAVAAEESARVRDALAGAGSAHVIVGRVREREGTAIVVRAG